MISYDFFKPRLCTEKTQGFLPAGSTACGADGSVEGNGLGCRGNGLRNRGLRRAALTNLAKRQNVTNRPSMIWLVVEAPSSKNVNHQTVSNCGNLLYPTKRNGKLLPGKTWKFIGNDLGFY